MAVEDDRLARVRRMVGEEGLARLQAAQVVVAGLGAVGSYAVEALARAGVGHLRLVDFDVVRPSNLNRQLYALHSTIGEPKVALAQRRVLDINPTCEVEALQEFVHVESMERVLAGPPSLALDAIDSFAPKVELLCAVAARGLPVVTSMGAALRTDPSQVRVGPLGETSGCPLARRLRKRLRQRGVPLDLLCVYSAEPVETSLVESDEEAAAGAEEHLTRGRRRRALGSLPTLTGIFGLTVANVALHLILDWPLPGLASPLQEDLQ